MENTGIWDFLLQNLSIFLTFTGFANATLGHYIMICVGLFFLYLGVYKKLEPMLLVPIGFGILIGNIPFFPGTQVGIYEEGSLLYFLHFGLLKGIYPPLIFLGLGAMIDFSALISNPKLMLVGIAAQLGIFAAYMIALSIGFSASDAGAIGIIGSADGPTSIFLASRLAPDLMGAIAISAYSYMALVPVIQPPIMKLLTKEKERVIKMRPQRVVSQDEKIIFPVIGLLLTCFFVPAGLPLLGMLFFGNFLKECGVTKRLATTMSGPMTDILTVLIGLTMGASTQATTFLTEKSLFIFGIGAISFIVATASGILFVKLMNLFLKEGNKINPLIGNAGVSALPDSARVSQEMGLRYDKSNHLLMHAMGPTVASTIGSAVVAGLMLGFLG
ncbi:MAG: sodium ion-translocating decarboxylase subunit beta [Tannerellaceae bacterium]|jgi:oxaloacetate decarboxylase beta subunit|nr:sodium ion-translocating decarboxylase subunit beta [Tannerellaceae bacterium]